MQSCRKVLMLTLATLAACHRAPPAPPPAPVPAGDPGRADADALEAARRARADSVAQAMARRADAERLARETAERQARAQRALRDTLAERVHFDFDRAELRPEDRPVVDRKVAILQANPSLRLQIAGNADERGSDEYNLVLGTRRATSIRTYLVTHGIAESRLEIRSYGEERPLVPGHDEAAWAMNRRDEFMPTPALDPVTSPPPATR